MKLRQFREQAGLSLTDLGVRIKLSTSYLTEIEHGKKYPKAEKIARMAEALGRNYDDLVSIRLDEQLSPLSNFSAHRCSTTFLSICSAFRRPRWSS